MTESGAFALVGAVLVLAGASARWIDRLPLSPALCYLSAGVLIGPAGFELLRLDIADQAVMLERLAEVAVLLSLFGVGLRLQLPAGAGGWRAPVRLAVPGMLLTIALAAAAGMALLGLSPAGALLLAAVLAPTDPVLASDVQLRHAGDRDAVRVAITAEGGLNDGTAFPAVVLALGLLGAHEIGAFGWRWWAVDVLWAGGAAVLLGWLGGLGLGRLLAVLRRTGTAPQSEEFLVLGMIALTYGAALLCRAYGFVAVFVAAVALADAERRDTERDARATGHRSAPAAVNVTASAAARGDAEIDVTHSHLLLRFAGQCERLMEVLMVLLVGVALAGVAWRWELLAWALALIAVARPLAVTAVLRGAGLKASQRRLIGWFGIRGVGSVYYLCYALTHADALPQQPLLIDATLVTLATSIVVHGISATPLMHRYWQRHERAGRR